MKNSNPTVQIKCTFSNNVHKLLEPNIGIKRSDRWKHRKNSLTDAEKIKLFDEIKKLHDESSNELTNYFYEKREKRRIHRARVLRGYVFKKKQTKEDYQKTLNTQTN